MICLQRSEKHQIFQNQTRLVNPEPVRVLSAAPALGRGGRPSRSIQTLLPAAFNYSKGTITLGGSSRSVD